MRSITHREMRNNSADVLRRVEAGESVQVTNNGRPAAMIIPVGGDTLDTLIERGGARAARSGVEALLKIRLAESEMSTAEILDDARGQW